MCAHYWFAPDDNLIDTQYCFNKGYQLASRHSSMPQFTVGQRGCCLPLDLNTGRCSDIIHAVYGVDKSSQVVPIPLLFFSSYSQTFSSLSTRCILSSSFLSQNLLCHTDCFESTLTPILAVYDLVPATINIMYYTLVLVSVFASAVLAHMQLYYPPTFGADNNPHRTDPADTELTYPYGCCGKKIPYPCRGYLDLLGTPQGASVATWAAGSEQNFR